MFRVDIMGDLERPQSHAEEAQASPRASFSIAGAAGSVSTSTSVSPSTSSSSSNSTKTAVSECLSSWLNYLQILNGLCSAGFKLSQSLSTLAHCNPDQSSAQHPLGMSHAASAGPPLLLPMLSGWDELARATAIATSTVKCHVVSALQEFVTHAQEGEVERAKENNYHIISDNISTLINLQYQFCIACVDCLSSAGPCPCCHSYPHDSDCNMATLQQCFTRMCTGPFGDGRDQSSSPHYVTSTASGAFTVSQGSLESPKGAGMEYRQMAVGMEKSERQQQPYYQERQYEYYKHFTPVDQGSGSTHVSSDSSRPGSFYMHPEGPRTPQEASLYRGPSPVEHLRGPSPIQGFLDTNRGPGHMEHMRGPLPNPGQLLGMKAPFHGAPRGLRSPLHFPLFPLGQRRWSEAAAAEVSGDSSDLDNTMRRWSMPWDSSKAEHSGWGGRGLGGGQGPSKLAVPSSRSGSDRSRSTTPDSIWQPSVTSQDGLAEAIQLLSCRPGVRPPPGVPLPPPEPWVDPPATGPPYLYSMWSGSERPGLPFIRLPETPEQQPPFRNEPGPSYNKPP